MKLALIFLAIVSLLELMLWLPRIWRWRKALAFTLSVLIVIVSLVLVFIQPGIWTVLLAAASGYRALNLMRLVKGRIQPDYLYRVAQRSSFLLIVFQLLIFSLVYVSYELDIDPVQWLYVLAVAQLLAAAALLFFTIRNSQATRPSVPAKPIADRDLPSLTVAIPARNETDDLQACLQSLIGSTYPKLEILVLDDCSQNGRTSEIIREFAQDGVRFLAGNVPPDSWLAKNHAYQQLADQANGQLILFCGVDTRFEPTTLHALVEQFLANHGSMMSVMPKNVPPGGHMVRSLLIQPSRYAWELALPRTWLRRPPVLSTCWLVTQEHLRAAGSFKALTRSIAPESHLARSALAKQAYSFIRSDGTIGLLSAKTYDHQLSTAIRTRYPQLHRRPEQAFLISVVQVFTLVLPFCMLISAALAGLAGLALLAGVTVLLLTGTYIAIVLLTYRRFRPFSLILLPFAALYDVGLLNYSMWRYEFREVIWKGRNVCLPVMRVIPSLPKLP